MTTKHISFKSGEFTLYGVLHLPGKLPAPFIVGCHGLFADKNSLKQKELAKACLQNGMAYLRFDHRGCGESEGDIATDTTIEARCEDLANAVEELNRYPETAGLAGLFGSSMGGAVVLAQAKKLGGIPVVTVAAPLHSEPVMAAVKLSENVNAEKLPHSFYERALKFDISKQVTGTQNVLLIHGQNDAVVPVEHARLIYDLLKEPKDLFIMEGGDHRLNAENHLKPFISKAVKWFVKDVL